MKNYNLIKTINAKMCLMSSLTMIWKKGAEQHKSHKEIRKDCFDLIFNSKDFGRLQTWARHELRGAVQACLDNHYIHLEWDKARGAHCYKGTKGTKIFF